MFLFGRSTLFGITTSFGSTDTKDVFLNGLFRFPVKKLLRLLRLQLPSFDTSRLSFLWLALSSSPEKESFKGLPELSTELLFDRLLDNEFVSELSESKPLQVNSTSLHGLRFFSSLAIIKSLRRFN